MRKDPNKYLLFITLFLAGCSGVLATKNASKEKRNGDLIDLRLRTHLMNLRSCYIKAWKTQGANYSVQVETKFKISAIGKV